MRLISDIDITNPFFVSIDPDALTSDGPAFIIWQLRGMTVALRRQNETIAIGQIGWASCSPSLDDVLVLEKTEASTVWPDGAGRSAEFHIFSDYFDEIRYI